MNKNQAFTILQRAGGIRAARIIIENMPNIGKFRTWCIARKLRRGVPVAKIIGRRWFYALEFYTGRHTLDPRPDTETLVSAVLADIRPDDSVQILDLGTGTGCIIGAICANSPLACGIGIDISHAAVRVARRNMQKLGLNSRVQILRRRFDRPIDMGRRFDIIVSNPPYIARGDTRVDAGARHDPARALYAGDGGLASYIKIAQYAGAWIKNGGKLYLEIGTGQLPFVRNIFTAAGWQFIRVELDLGGVERVLVFQRIAS